MKLHFEPDLDYQLQAVEAAYEQKLVKQIEVAAATVEDAQQALRKVCVGLR